MEIDRNKLPEDVAALRHMVAGLLGVGLQGAAAPTAAAQVRAVAALALRPRRERVNENQFFLFAVAIVRAGRRLTGAGVIGRTQEAEDRRQARPWPATLPERWPGNG